MQKLFLDGFVALLRILIARFSLLIHLNLCEEANGTVVLQPADDHDIAADVRIAQLALFHVLFKIAFQQQSTQVQTLYAAGPWWSEIT